MKILGVNLDWKDFSYPDYYINNVNDREVFTGYDVLIINSKGFYSNYIAKRNALIMANLSHYNDNEYKKSDIIKAEISNLQFELTNVLKNGKNIYIFIDKNSEINTIRYLFSSFDFLPKKINYEQTIIPFIEINKDTKYSHLLFEINDLLQPNHCIFTKDKSLLSLATSMDDTRNVSFSIKDEKGEIVFLPALKEKLTETEQVKVLDAIVRCENSLDIISNNDYNLPDWANNYNLPKEKESKAQLNSLELEKEDIIEKIENQEKTINHIQEYKRMFTADGDILENIVKKILTELDFTFEETVPNRTDIIANYKEQGFVFEVKGVSKSAGEKNSAQLRKWSSEYYYKYLKEAKAVLLVNTYKEKPLEERTEVNFPDQMLENAHREKQCLVTGVQFLCMYYDIQKNPSKKDEILQKLFDTIGIYEEYINYQDYINISNKD